MTATCCVIVLYEDKYGRKLFGFRDALANTRLLPNYVPRVCGFLWKRTWTKETCPRPEEIQGIRVLRVQIHKHANVMLRDEDAIAWFVNKYETVTEYLYRLNHGERIDNPTFGDVMFPHWAAARAKEKARPQTT